MKKDREKKKGKIEEEIKIALEASPNEPISRSSRWVFDTEVSSYMTNNVDLFINIEDITGRVLIANNTLIAVKGRGSILFMVKTLEGSLLLVLINILLVPELGRVNLILWKVIQKVNRGLVLYSSSDNIYVKKGSIIGETII